MKTFRANNVTDSAVTDTQNQDIHGLASYLASAAKIDAGGSSDSHLAFIRSMVKKPVIEVRKAYEMAKDGRALIQRRSSFSFSRAAVEAYVISKMTVEPLELTSSRSSKRIKVYRIYVTSTGGGEYCKVGWVVQDSATHCLRCKGGFGMLNTKHNCVACGDVVCSRCSPSKVLISELRSEDPHRVCVACYNPKVRIITIYLFCIYLYTAIIIIHGITLSSVSVSIFLSPKVTNQPLSMLVGRSLPRRSM